MSYWELAKEPWEDEDNYDGALLMTLRGRIEMLEKLYVLECVPCDRD